MCLVALTRAGEPSYLNDPSRGVGYDHRQGIKLLSAVHLLQPFQCALGLALLKCVRS
jgi:hypothetical protein